jgi:hypothetical protein
LGYVLASERDDTLTMRAVVNAPGQPWGVAGEMKEKADSARASRRPHGLREARTGEGIAGERGLIARACVRLGCVLRRGTFLWADGRGDRHWRTECDSEAA